MDTLIADVTALASGAVDALGPALVTVGGAGVVLVGGFAIYGMITKAVASRGKRI